MTEIAKLFDVYKKYDTNGCYMRLHDEMKNTFMNFNLTFNKVY